MQPLKGVRVVEMAHLFPGPYLAHILNDLGADVVKIEPPAGDSARHMPPFVEETGHGFAFGAVNAGKRSVVLDLKTDAGRDAAAALIETSDIVVNGYRPGVAERLGVGADVCLERNPDLVYVHMTGWGPEGPRTDMPGHDIAYQALAGCLQPTAEPMLPPVPAADVLGAVWGACVAVAALREAERDGVGRLVPISLSGAALAASTLSRAMEYAGHDPANDPHPLVGGLPGYHLYQCRDGRWIALGILEPEYWQTLCDVLGDEDLVELGLPTTREEATAAHAAVQAHIALRDRAEWLTAFRGAELPFAPVVTAAEGPDAGAAGGSVVPPHMGAHEEAYRAPRLGAHTGEVLEEWVNWDADRIGAATGTRAP